MNVLPIDYVNLRLKCDPKSGTLFWRERDRGQFKNHRDWLLWNAKHAGNEAGSISIYGYLKVTIGTRAYMAHRLIWTIVHGEWPEAEIDHINGDRSDNRICNLRSVSTAENARNRKQRKNQSGHMGVYPRLRDGKWTASIRGVDRKSVYLGAFDTKEEAAEARRAAQSQHGYHENHGRAR